MSKRNGSRIIHPSSPQQDNSDEDLLTPASDALAKAASSLWGKPLHQPLADAIGAEPHTAKVFTQFIEQFPVTAVVTFAITYGYMLRKKIEEREAAERRVLLT